MLLPHQIKLVSVAIATYNGEKYLEAQLNSIYAQTYTNIQVVVCDDKSTDNTVSILEHFKLKFGLIYFINESTLGVAKNFERAISLCTGDYISLCDQDDIWIPEKIEICIKKIQSIELDNCASTPILVFTDLMIVNAHLLTQYHSMWQYLKINPTNSTFNRLLIDNIITGCTILINRPLVDLALPFPDSIIKHDAWLGLVASYFGKIGYLPRYTVLYRQHEKNVIGAIRNTKSIIKKILEYNNPILDQELSVAKSFISKYANYLPINKKFKVVLESFIKCKNATILQRCYLILKYKLFSSGFKRTIRIILNF